MAKITDTAVRIFDGFRNALTGLQTSADSHAVGGHWFTRPISTQEIEASYRTSWLAKKITNIPATDQVRPWRSWKATPEQITAIEKEERRLGLRQKVRKALVLSRMYGGAAIILGVNGDEPSQPLNVNAVKQGGLSYIHVLTRHELTVTAINMDPGSPTYGEPLAYMAVGGGNIAEIHPSRVVRFVNNELPDTLAFAEQSWGDPIMMVVRDAIANADAAQGNFAALTSKALTSTLSTPGLLELVSTTDGEQKFIAKTRLMQQFRSMFNLNIVAGAKNSNEVGETLTDTTFSFANIPEMGTWFIQLVAGAADVPVTRLLGTSPGGLNSTGESDTENYWTMLDAGRELDLRPRMEMIDEVLIRSALGNRPSEIWFDWSPFEVDTEQTRATNANLRATAAKNYADSGAIPSDVLMKIVKGQVIDGGEYPGAEEAYAEYEAAGGDYEPIEAPMPANDNPIMSAAIEGGVAAGKTASVAARDAIALCDSVPRPLYVARMVLNRDELQVWATEQGLGELQPDLHVTIAYSTAPVDWMTMENSWADHNNDGSGQLLVTAGGPRLVEPLGDQTAVLMFSNTDLQWRNEEMRRKGCSWDFPDYTPHISLTKNAVDLDNVRPYRGPILLGAEIFQTLDDDLDEDD